MRTQTKTMRRAMKGLGAAAAFGSVLGWAPAHGEGWSGRASWSAHEGAPRSSPASVDLAEDAGELRLAMRPAPHAATRAPLSAPASSAEEAGLARAQELQRAEARRLSLMLLALLAEGGPEAALLASAEVRRP